MKYNSYYNTKMIVVYRIEKIYKFRRFVTEEFLLLYMPRRYARTLLNLPYFIVEVVSPSKDTEMFPIKSVQGEYIGMGIIKEAFQIACVEVDESWE